MELNDIISSGLLELYATGIATPEETAQVLQWAQAYPEVKKELEQIEAKLEAFAQVNAVSPNPVVKQRVMATINEENRPGLQAVPASQSQPGVETARYVRIWKVAAAAALLLLAGSAVLNLVLFQKNRAININLQEANAMASAMELKARGMEGELQVVQNKFSLPVSLNSTGASTDAAAKVFWIKNTGDVYVDPSNLPTTPNGKQYELWAIVSGKPVNAGIIITTKKGNRFVIQKMKSFGSAEAFAVSLEPANPSPAQTPTDVVVMGKM